MYAQPPCSTCTLATGRQHLKQKLISNSGPCGSLAQVVYVPIPVFMSPTIRECETSCCPCAHSQRLDLDNGFQCRNRKEAEEDENVSRPFPRFRQSISEVHVRKSDVDNLEHQTQQQEFKSTTQCEHGNNEVFDSCRQRFFEFNNGMMMCPRVIGGCCSSRMNGVEQRNIIGHFQGCENSKIPPGSPVKMRKKINKEVKTVDAESTLGLRAHRRLSADSGRVTWSESGESVYSDLQSADYSRRISTTATKTSVTTSQSQFSFTSTVNTNASSHIEPKKPSRRASHHDRLMTRPLNHSSERTTNHGDTGINFSPMEIYRKKQSTRPSSTRSRPFFEDKNSLENDYTKRSSSENELQKTFLSLTKYEQTIAEGPGQHCHTGRPRSQSLFVEQPIKLQRSSRSVSPNILNHMTNMSLREQPGTVDFTAWTDVNESREIGGVTNTGEDIKAYGLTATPLKDGFVLTDADKVKIKLYGLDGNLKRSFGTPTWPRYGRGVTLTPNNKYIAVCHLSEVCIYTFEGAVRDRFPHEKFTACWGIVCNTQGNYVITDPKASSVFIMSPNGNIIKQIGGNTSRCAPTKQTTGRSKMGWKKRVKRRTRTREQDMSKRIDSSYSNISIPLLIGLGNSKNEAPKSDKQVRLLAPRYVAVNSKNQILVTDTRQRSLLCFEQDGTLVFSIGGGRTGCKKCCSRKVPRERHGVTSIALSSAQMKSFGSLSVIESTWKEGLSPEAIRTKSSSFNFLSEICNPNIGMCKAKNERVKVLGTIYRGNVGRNESVESAAYQAHQSRKSPDCISNNSAEIAQSPSSASIGSRLHCYSENPKEMCSSYIDLSENEKTQRKNSNPFQRLTKSIRKPLWRRRQQTKKTDEVIDKADERKLSLVIPEPLTADCSSCPQSCHWYTPDTATTVFSYDSDNKTRKSPAPSRNGKYLFEEASDEYSIISMESSQGDECDDESDGERTACRRCHVEDPRGVCVDENDNILLVDRARHRVTLFNPEGHFVRHLLTDEDGLNEPMTICLLNDTSLAITDSSACIKIFDFKVDY